MLCKPAISYSSASAYLSRRGMFPPFTSWLTDAETSGLASFVSLVHGIRADYAAVEAALATDWSKGPSEGHVHRV